MFVCLRYKVWAMVSFMNDLSREPEALVLRTDTFCPAYSGYLVLQWQLWYSGQHVGQVCHGHLMGVLLQAHRARCGSCPEYLALVSRPLTVFTVASAWPLLLGFLSELVLWSKFHSLENSANMWLPNWGPLSDLSVSGIPCSENSSFSTDVVLLTL